MASIDVASTRSGATLVRLLWLATLVLVLISVAMVTTRALDLLGVVPTSSKLSTSAPTDAAFARHGNMTPKIPVADRSRTPPIAICVLIANAVTPVTRLVCIRRRQVARHREWMIRAFALGLAVATIRPIVGVFTLPLPRFGTCDVCFQRINRSSYWLSAANVRVVGGTGIHK